MMKRENDQSLSLRLRGMVVLLPGLALVSLVLLAAGFLQSTPLFSRVLPLSSLILAILIGALVRNTVPLPAWLFPGVAFSARKILRLAIVFLGFKLSVADVVSVGPIALVTVLLASGATMALTVFLGTRMRLPLKRSLLIGGGVSICGAAAIAALNGVVRAEDEDVAFAIGVVTLFGTAFMFLYPAIFSLFHVPGFYYALWTGESVHEVAQVAAAGGVAGEHFRALASTVKMIRVLLIVPATLTLSFLPLGGNREVDAISRVSPPDSPGPESAKGHASKTQRSRVHVPWFALMFFAVVVLNSVVPLSNGFRAGLVGFDNIIMSAALAALGLEISFKAMAKNGRTALLLGLAASIFISGFSAALTYLSFRL